MKEYIVDSCILISFLKLEPGFLKVQNLLSKGFDSEIQLYMSSVNVGEAYFIAARSMPEYEVQDFIKDLKTNYNFTIFDPNYEDCISAAKYKTLGEIAYFDCFNLVLAKKFPKAEILTLDRKYEKFAKDFKIQFL